MSQGETESILGYRVSRDGITPCVDSIINWVRCSEGGCRCLACLNPHSYVVAKSNPEFEFALKQADWVIPDGAGIVLASRVLKGRIHERVTGSDVFRQVHERLNEEGGSVFFLGATDETLEIIRMKMQQDYPHIRVAGTYSPPFKSVFTAQESNAMVSAVNEVAPDVLWVGMTSPKQDLWIHENAHRLQVRFAAGVGAVFDFYSGRVKRSHPLFQQLGLEWLPRLLKEPRRLWRRTFASTPIFLTDVLRCAIKQRKFGDRMSG